MFSPMRACIALAFWLASSALAPCINPAFTLAQCRQETWTRLKGLPSNDVTALAQSRFGYLWVGTGGGIARFDGIRFVTATTENTPELGGNIVSALCETSDGALWAGTATGALVRFLNGVATSLELPEYVDRVTSLCPARQGGVWVGTDRGLLFSDGAAVKNDPRTAATADYPISVVQEGNDGALWIGTADGMLFRLAGGVIRNLQELGFPRFPVQSIRQAPDGVVWVATDGGGLVRWARGRLSIYDESAGIPSNRLVSVLADHVGVIWTGTRDGRILRFFNGVWTAYPLEGTPTALLEDFQGSLWAGTNGEGLVRWKDTAVLPVVTISGLPGRDVVCVEGSPSGTVFGASRTRGAFACAVDGTVSPVDLGEGCDGRDVRCVHVDPDGTVWFGLTGSRIVRLQSGAARRFGPGDGLPEGDVHVLGRDAAGNLLSGVGACLVRFNGTRFNALPLGPPSALTQVRAFLSRPGTLWVGTDNGVLTLREGTIGVLAGEGIPNGMAVRDMDLDAEGTLWLVTANNGLVTVANGKGRVFSSGDGLPFDAIAGMAPDASGNFWLAGSGGVACVARKLLSPHTPAGARIPFRLYDETAGMTNALCAGDGRPALWRSPQGRLWVATRGGLVILDPARLTAHVPERLQVVMEMVQAGQTQLSPAADLSIKAAAGSVEFRYTAPDFLDPDGIRFRYKLEGFDPDWVYAGTARLAHYGEIPPGSYIFRVQAARRTGDWEEPGATLPVRITGRFYQSVWFRILCGVLAVLVVVLHVIRRRRARDELVDDLRQQLAERTQGMEKAYETARMEQDKARDRAAEAAMLREKLETVAHLDPVSGATTRRHFSRVLEEEWRRCAAQGLPIMLILADIDHFRLYNEKHGPKQGDACLGQVAQALRQRLQPGETLARYGGGQFVILLPGTCPETAKPLAENFRLALEEQNIAHGASPVSESVTLSLGVAIAVEMEHSSSADLVGLADEALQLARRSGGNQTIVRTLK